MSQGTSSLSGEMTGKQSSMAYGEPSTGHDEKPGEMVMAETASTRSHHSSTESLHAIREHHPQKSPFNPFLIPTSDFVELDPTCEPILSHAKSWDLAQRLLSFQAILSSIRAPLTAMSLAVSGFIAYKDKSGKGSYACAHCNLVIGEFPNDCQNNPEAFHRSISPSCSFFSETDNQEVEQSKTQHGNHDQG